MTILRAALALCGILIFARSGITGANEVSPLTAPESHEQTTQFSDAPSSLALSIAGDTVGSLSAAQLNNVLSGFKPEVKNRTRGVKDAQIYARVSPSVVYILTKDGSGSGILISDDGTVLTNAHVIGKNDSVAIAFKPKQEGGVITKADLLIARTVRIDDVTDLAIVKIASVPDGVKPVALGNMREVAVGDDVHAIGHPLGQTWTYTKGYVSQIRADYKWKGSADGPAHKARVIQTQTPINPGNSGGPLFSAEGTLVGVNSFVTSNAQGLNYAVSIEDVRSFLSSDIVAKPKIECRPRMGETKEAQVGNLKGKKTPVDMDCSGRASGFHFVPDDASKPILLFVFLSDGGQMVVYDSKRSGKWEKSLFYEKNGTKPIAVGYHDDGRSTPTRIERIKRDQG